MNLRNSTYWAILLAVACNGKLSTVPAAVDVPAKAAGGSGGSGGFHNFAGSGGALVEVLAGMAGDAESGGGVGGSDAAGEGGEAGVSSDAGKLGHPCIPGGLITSVEGSPAQATIATLTRCNVGASCAAGDQCAPETDCEPNAGPCVVRRAPFEEDLAKYEQADAYQNTGIVALAASESHVYWLEYGTRDTLWNYLHDGVLKSYDFADGKTTTIASGLDGPDQLGLTTTHAYISIWHGPPVSESQLIRVPLAGGSPQVVRRYPAPGAQPSFFFGPEGSQMFWSERKDSGSALYSISSEVAAVPTLFLATDDNVQSVSDLAGDGMKLFFRAAPNARVMRTPTTEAAPIATGASASYGFALHGDDIITIAPAVERVNFTDPPPNGVLLSRTPKSGGQPQQIRPLGAGYPNALQVVGDRYFFGVIAPEQAGTSTIQNRVLTAEFDADVPPLQLLEYSRERYDRFLWVGTAHALYWTDGKALREQPLTAQ